MGIALRDYQEEAICNMKNGCILCGDVGSGKSMTSIAYYYTTQHCSLKEPGKNRKDICDLVIITTARKRDTFEWEGELSRFLLSPNENVNYFNNKVIIDSWNNIQKYVGIENAFFIFDEQRVVGYGAWTKAFLKIAKKNSWILLSATPGDTWSDYIPVFIANGFYKNKTEFSKEHIVYSRYSNFPKIDRYVKTGRLIRLRNSILVTMNYQNKTELHHIDIYTDYDLFAYKMLMKDRWNVEKNQPIENASELCYELRKICNSDISRLVEVEKIAQEKGRVIIFYNFDYELELLKAIDIPRDFEIAEWNGHKHQPIPDSKRWIYLVQYNAGAEGWNCIKTDTIVFYSQNYSYKMMVQSAGRINRLNTPFEHLYYYHLKSRSSIDIAIARALKEKKKFNEVRFVSN